MGEGDSSLASVTLADGIPLIDMVCREKWVSVVETFTRDLSSRTDRGKRVTARLYVVTWTKVHFE